MANRMITLTALCVAVLMLGTTAYSKTKKQEPSPAKPDTVKLVGTVNAVKNTNGVVTFVKLVTASTTYSVVLDSKGLELGKTADGKKVEAEGIVTQKEKEKWVTIKSFRRVSEKPADKK